MHPSHEYEASKSSLYKSMANVRSSQIFYSIADDDMSDFFMNYIEEEEEKEEGEKEIGEKEVQVQKGEEKEMQKEEVSKAEIEAIKQQVQLAEQTQQITLDKVQPQDNPDQPLISRLEIQLKKHNLEFIPVYGQIFIMIINAQLLAADQQRKEAGKLLVTNYRFAFFKGRVKKLDLPYGFIGQCRFNQKACEITFKLKYQHFWRVKVMEEKNYAHLKIFLQIYLKIESIRSCFAFAYALKHPQHPKSPHNLIINQFSRLQFPQSKEIHLLDNTDFIICSTYPQLIYVPIKVTVNGIAKLVKFWAEGRFPVAVYGHGLGLGGMIWRASSLVCDRADDLKDVAKYLDYIRRKSDKLVVYDCGFKINRKGMEEFEINSQCQMKYLEADTLQSIKVAYLAMVQCFLSPKKTFIKDLLASKWYDGVIQYLKGANDIASKVLGHGNVLIKCVDGRDKSAVFSALAQIIINPYYRTFTGFSILVQKQFHFFSHPFLDRLGLTPKKDSQIPIFILFLDCVSQLLHTNEMSFQYNYKYLSKLSNLMYTCLFGTFITNTRKESIENCVQAETVGIWGQLVSELTCNAYYYQKSGVLQVPGSFDDVRVWKEHFWYLTTAPKESYRIHPLAEDNLDYINLQCHKVMKENQTLQHEISQQKLVLDSLKAKLQAKQQQPQPK